MLIFVSEKNRPLLLAKGVQPCGVYIALAVAPNTGVQGAAVTWRERGIRFAQLTTNRAYYDIKHRTMFYTTHQSL